MSGDERPDPVDEPLLRQVGIDVGLVHGAFPYHAVRPIAHDPVASPSDSRLAGASEDPLVYVPAMPRLREIPRAEVESKMVLSMYDRLFGDRDPVAEPGTATGTPGDWWTVFANSPDVLEHACRGFALYARPEPQDRPEAPRARPDPRRLACSAASSCSRSTARPAGPTASPRRRSRRIKSWSVSDLFSPKERALLAYTDALVPRARARPRRRVRPPCGSTSTTRRSWSSPTSR